MKRLLLYDGEARAIVWREEGAGDGGYAHDVAMLKTDCEGTEYLDVWDEGLDSSDYRDALEAACQRVLELEAKVAELEQQVRMLEDDDQRAGGGG